MFPKLFHMGWMLLISLPCVITYIRPKKMLDVAMVTMIVGTRKYCRTSPFTSPMIVPMTAAARMARMMLPPRARVITATAYSTTWAMAVKDTSVPPRMRTKRVPTAMMPSME